MTGVPQGLSIKRSSRRALALALAAACCGALYALNLDRVVGLFQGLYDADASWRLYALVVRLRGYARFLPLLACAFILWAAALRMRAVLDSLLESASRLLGGRGRRAAGATAALVLAATAYEFSTMEWVRFGRPCWDGYCEYTDLLEGWLFSRSPGAREELLRFVHGYLHSSSPVGPLLIGVLKAGAGLSTDAAYRLACGLATFGAASLVWHSLLPRAMASASVRAAALALFLSNLVLVRSSFFPQTDAFVLFWTTALLVAALRRLDRPGAFPDLLCLALLASGLFVKLSFLPALALIPVWTCVRFLSGSGGAPENRRDLALVLAKETALFSILPALPYLLFHRGLGVAGSFGRELSVMVTADSYPPFALMSFLHAGLVSAVLIGFGRRRLRTPDFLLLSWVALYLASLWLGRVPGWDRYYLAVVPALGVAAATGLETLAEAHGAASMWLFVGLAVFLNYAALWLGLYY